MLPASTALSALPFAPAAGAGPTPADLVFVVLLVVGAPLVSLWDDRALRADLADHRPTARLRAYLRASAVSWALASVAWGLWRARGGTLTGLGLGFPTRLGPLILLALGVAFAALSLRQLRQRTTGGAAPATATELRSVAHLLPATRSELWAFRGAATSAGLTEEVVYRGWLLGVLVPVVGPWISVPGAALISGAAQLHQGTAGLVRGVVFGLVTGLAFVVTGNLWGLVVAHVALDLLGGEMAWRLRGEVRPAGDGVPDRRPGEYRIAEPETSPDARQPRK